MYTCNTALLGGIMVFESDPDTPLDLNEMRFGLEALTKTAEVYLSVIYLQRGVFDEKLP